MSPRASLLSFALALAPAICLAQVASEFGGLPQVDPNNTQTRVQGLPVLGGTVYGNDGRPSHDIRIEVRSLVSGQVVALSYSGMNGTFSFMGIRPGNYEVVALDGLIQTRHDVRLEAGMMNVDLRMPRRSMSSTVRNVISVAELKIPEKARHLLDKARTLLTKNRQEEARKDIDSSLAIAPDYADALTTRALLKLGEKQTDSAENDLDHAIKSDPSYAPAYLLMGALYNQMGRFDDALRSLDRSATFAPNSWQCAYETAKAWMGKHDYDRALRELNRAQALGGGGDMAGQIHILRGYALLGQKHIDEASAELQAYLANNPNGPMASSVRAELAKIKTVAVQNQSTIVLPAMSLFATDPE